MITVEFYIKGKPKDFRRFSTMCEAAAFKRAMMLNNNCDGVWILTEEQER